MMMPTRMEIAVGRHERRTDMREFRKTVRRGHVLTHLLDVRADLSPYPRLERVAAAWHRHPQRKPVCFGCSKSYAATAKPGAFLFASQHGAGSDIALSVLCVELA